MKTDVIINRDALCALQELPSESVHCCVTSPPYFALRDYGLDAQIGQEDTPEQYIDRLTAVFGELYRVLRKDGTLWLNIADTYCGTGNKGGYADPKNPKGRTGQRIARNSRVTGCKQKDLIGIPWLLAFSLREQGWYLRSDIIWQKQNPMPESCKDRPTRCYEHIFLLSKEKKYYYDAAAIAEPLAPTTAERYRRARSTNSKYTLEIPGQGKVQGLNRPRDGGYYDDALMPTTRNKRDVWLINTVPYKGAHFAAFPPKLAETCILAGCPKGGIVIDPFFGSGTTGFAAKSLDRHYIGIELNAEYCALARARIGGAGLSSSFLNRNGLPKVAVNYESMFRGLVRKYNKTQKVALPKVMTPHTLRHTFCTTLANAGMNPKALQYIMGHSNINMTLNYYAHTTSETSITEMKRLIA